MRKGKINMSSWEIEIHFDKMKELSDALAQTAVNLQKTADNRGTEAVSGIKAAWISENADIFAGKERKLIIQVSETAANLNSLSKEIEEKAKEIYHAELHNTLTARARSYR